MKTVLWWLRLQLAMAKAKWTKQLAEYYCPHFTCTRFHQIRFTSPYLILCDSFRCYNAFSFLVWYMLGIFHSLLLLRGFFLQIAAHYWCVCMIVTFAKYHANVIYEEAEAKMPQAGGMNKWKGCEISSVRVTRCQTKHFPGQLLSRYHIHDWYIWI